MVIKLQPTLRKQLVSKNDFIITVITFVDKDVTIDSCNLFSHTGKNCQEGATADKAADDHETKMAREVEEGCSEDEVEVAEGIQPTSPLMDELPPVSDVLQTPQLSDFGLSQMGLKKDLAGSDWCLEEPPMPQISLPQSFSRPELPPKPVTPKCALWLDDDEPQTPKLQEFAISEPTLFIFNDFTMDLFNKNVQKLQR